MKRLLFVFMALLLLVVLPVTALAADSITVSVSVATAAVGDEITVSGTAPADTWITLEGTDADCNILYFSARLSDSAGAYSVTFKAPEMDDGTLTFTAGNGDMTAKTTVEIHTASSDDSDGDGTDDESAYCTVTFNKNGGDAEASPKTVTIKEGEKVDSLPAAPVKEGYTFSGWYRENACSTVWSISDSVTADLTVYAKWTINTYSVKFYREDGITQIGTTQKVRWGNAATAQTAPAHSGYKFDRWVLTGDNDAVGTNLTSVKENITAVASYTNNDTEATKTPSPSASATVTASATQSTSATETVVSTVSATVSSLPESSVVSEATPEPTIIPVEVKKDEETGIITIVIDTDDLPEGTAAVQLPDGSVVDVSGGGTVTLEITGEDLDMNGMAHIAALDEEGTPLSDFAIQVIEKPMFSIAAIFLWGVGGLLVVGIALFVVIRWKKR